MQGQYLSTEANVAAPESSIFIEVMYVDPKTPSSVSQSILICLSGISSLLLIASFNIQGKRIQGFSFRSGKQMRKR